MRTLEREQCDLVSELTVYIPGQPYSLKHYSQEAGDGLNLGRFSCWRG